MECFTLCVLDVQIILTLSFSNWDSWLVQLPCYLVPKRSFMSEMNKKIFTDGMLKIHYAINCFHNSKFPVLNHHLNSVGEYNTMYNSNEYTRAIFLSVEGSSVCTVTNQHIGWCKMYI